jgi:hypothetical protein
MGATWCSLLAEQILYLQFSHLNALLTLLSGLTMSTSQNVFIRITAKLGFVKPTFTIPFDCNTQIVHPMSAKFSTSIHLSDSEAFMVLSLNAITKSVGICEFRSDVIHSV